LRAALFPDVENGLPAWAQVRLTEIELGGPNYNTFAALARADRPAASLNPNVRPG
jgi:hypothetical protein